MGRGVITDVTIVLAMASPQSESFLPRVPMVDDAAVTQCFLSAAALGALIDTTQDNISRLQSALQKERGTLAQLLWMLAPIGKLPVETLVQIFKYSVQTCHEELTASESAEGRTLTRTPMQQLLTLSGVCSRWMAIINSTPELWSLHAVEVRLDKINKATTYIPVLKTLLQRSAQLPISVFVTQQDPDCDTRFGFGIRTFGTSLVTETVIQAMVPTAPRWKHLTVDQASFYPLATLRGGTFRSLESLNMRYDVEPLDGTNVASDPICIFSSAPVLRRLALSMHDKATIFMPWAQLTHLSLRYAPLSRCLAIILQCRPLVVAEFITTGWDFGLAPNGAPQQAKILPALDTLRMTFNYDGGTEVEPFFGPLILPALHAICLVFDPAPARSFVWATPFQSRSPFLTHLTLRNCTLDSSELTALLRLAPSLTTLILQNCFDCIDDASLGEIKYDGKSASLVPELKYLHLDGVGYSFSDQALITAIRSRWWPDHTEERDVVRLRKVSVSRYSGDPMSQDFIDSMQTLVKQGLDIALEFPEY